MVGSVGLFDGTIFFFDPVVRKITNEMYEDFEKTEFYKKYARWRGIEEEAAPTAKDDATLVHEATLVPKSLKTLFIEHEDEKGKRTAHPGGHADIV